MSTNIDSVETLTIENLRIRGDHLEEVIKKLEQEGGPEASFLDDFPDPYDRRSDWAPDKWFDIEDLSWYGVWSGNSYDNLLGAVLPKTMGKASAIFTWEGGDRTGVSVCDGEVLIHDVEMTLGKGKKVK